QRVPDLLFHVLIEKVRFRRIRRETYQHATDRLVAQCAAKALAGMRWRKRIVDGFHQFTPMTRSTSFVHTKRRCPGSMRVCRKAAATAAGVEIRRPIKVEMSAGTLPVMG